MKWYSVVIFLFVLLSSFFLLETILTPEKTFPNFPTNEDPSQTKTVDSDPSEDPLKEKASAILSSLSLEEKIAQALFVRYPNTDEQALEWLATYPFGAYLFFQKDFRDLSPEAVKERASALQQASKVPILLAVDEEGGSVNRISSHPLLADAPFPSSQKLYQTGGMEAIVQDTIAKSQLLFSYGIQLNLAPVVDVSTNPSDFMYQRSLGEDAVTTAEYAATVIQASKGYGVSYTLKHFPGYGNNVDTHTGIAIDNRTYEELQQVDLLPFIAGIQAGAEAILVSHNIVTAIDSQNPASLSPAIHKLLREDLHFQGIILTDDLAMGAIASVPDASVQAILAGNNLLITSDPMESISSLEKAVQEGVITEEQIDQAILPVLIWKLEKGIM